MSSNIKITRICQHCGHEFVAKTTVTKYCDKTCAKRAYKARIKKQKVAESESPCSYASSSQFQSKQMPKPIPQILQRKHLAAPSI
jgi:hypothetical protein